MAKDKKKKKNGKQDRKAQKGVTGTAAKRLKSISQNPLVADIVAAALVGMATALKDSDKARRLASDAGEQLQALSKKTAREGSAMWDLALNVGRRTLDALANEGSAKPKGKAPK